MVVLGSEFSVADQRGSDRRSPLRWLASHLLRHPGYVAGFVLGSAATVGLNSAVPGLTGWAFDTVLSQRADRGRQLTVVVLVLLLVVAVRGLVDLAARLCSEVLAKRLERDTRDELYVSLLGKSQTFHNRQRIGDLMARATNDVRQLNFMVSPGIDLVTDSLLQGIVPIVLIGFLDPRLLLAPLLFAAAFVITVRWYMRQLAPVSGRMRSGSARSTPA